MPPISTALTKATAAAKPSLSTCVECGYHLGPLFVRCGIAILIIIFMLHMLSVCDKGRSLVRGRSRGISLNEGRVYGSTEPFERDNPRLSAASYFSVFEKGNNTSG